MNMGIIAASRLRAGGLEPSINLFGSLSGNNKWVGGVLAPNGKIYGIPNTSTQVLEIDPVNQTTSLFGSFSSGSSKWYISSNNYTSHKRRGHNPKGNSK